MLISPSSTTPSPVRSGLTPTENGLFVEDKESPYVNLIVARENNRDDEKVKEFVQAFQTDEGLQEGDRAVQGRSGERLVITHSVKKATSSVAFFFAPVIIARSTATRKTEQQ